jgi:hypothetical protein
MTGIRRTRRSLSRTRNANRLHRAGLLALAMVITGCAGSDHAAAPGYAAVRRLALDSGPRITIPDAAPDGSWALENFENVQLLRDGGFAVAGTSEIHVFDAEGRHTATLGRRGQGPGEFERIGRFAECPDGAYAVMDWMLRRLTILPPPPLAARVVAFNAAGGGLMAPVRCGSGRILFLGFTLDPNTASPWPAHTMRQDTVVVLLADDTLAHPDTLVRVPDMSTFDGLQQPFGTFAQVASNDRMFVTGMTGDSILELHWAAGGRVQRVVISDLPVTTVTANMRAERVAFSERETPRGIWVRELKAIYANVPWPDRMPLWDRLILDDSSRVWVREYQSNVVETPVPGRWHMTTADGSTVAVLTLPATDSLLFVRGSDAVLVHRAADDTESLEVRRVLGL